jgi:hypothetical protein
MLDPHNNPIPGNHTPSHREKGGNFLHIGTKDSYQRAIFSPNRPVAKEKPRPACETGR